MVRPMVRTPRSCSIAATVELSTPPDMATATGAAAKAVAPGRISDCAVEVIAPSVSAGGGERNLTRGEAANALDDRGDHRNRMVDFLRCRRTSQTEAQARAGILARKPCGEQNVRRLGRTGRTGRACGAGDALEVQRNQKRLATGTGKTQVRRIRHATGTSAIHTRRWNPREQLGFQAIAKPADAKRILSEQSARQFGGLSHAHNARNIFGTRAAIALRVPAKETGSQRRAGANKKRTHALGSAKLVRGNREQIHSQAIHIEGNLPRRLDRVAMKAHALLGRDPCDLFDWLDDAKLVIGVHHAEE